MTQRIREAHMKAAYVYAGLSRCNRRQVGCVIVKGPRIISIGYNGTPSGADNQCEDDEGNTYPNVVHAEDNALQKLIRTHDCADGADLYVTTAPCGPCTDLIIKANISRVYYAELHRHQECLDKLRHNDIEVIHIPIQK